MGALVGEAEEIGLQGVGKALDQNGGEERSLGLAMLASPLCAGGFEHLAKPTQDGVVGVNQTDFLSRWDGAALVTSSLVDDGSNVGIGVAIPSATLDVGGDIAVNGSVLIDDAGNWVGNPTGLIGPKPDHQWISTCLSFQRPDGAFEPCVELRGPKGDKGDQGAKGDKGDKGDQGEPGECSTAICTWGSVEYSTGAICRTSSS